MIIIWIIFRFYNLFTSESLLFIFNFIISPFMSGLVSNIIVAFNYFPIIWINYLSFDISRLPFQKLFFYTLTQFNSPGCRSINFCRLASLFTSFNKLRYSLRCI